MIGTLLLMIGLWLAVLAGLVLVPVMLWRAVVPRPRPLGSQIARGVINKPGLRARGDEKDSADE